MGETRGGSPNPGGSTPGVPAVIPQSRNFLRESAAESAQSFNPHVEDPHYLSSTRHIIKGLCLQQVKVTFNAFNDLKMDFSFQIYYFQAAWLRKPCLVSDMNEKGELQLLSSPKESPKGISCDTWGPSADVGARKHRPGF